MGTPRSARGSMKDARTPLCENGNGPSSLKQIQGASHLAWSGACSAGQTIESSASLRVIEVKVAVAVHAGGRASAAKRQMAKLPGIRQNLRCMEADCLSGKFTLPSCARYKTAAFRCGQAPNR